MAPETKAPLFSPAERFALDADSPVPLYHQLEQIVLGRIKNETGAHHPFHLHGFSFQPIAMYDFPGFPNPPPDAGDPGTMIYEYDYNEFVDTVIIPADHTVKLRVRLDDRRRTLGPWKGWPGGAIGRWLFHCHIFFHAHLGMISELVVLPAKDE